MIDQSHNLKGKIEATGANRRHGAGTLAQRLRWLIANSWQSTPESCDLVAAEELFRGAFWRDVRPACRRLARSLAGSTPIPWPR